MWTALGCGFGPFLCVHALSYFVPPFSFLFLLVSGVALLGDESVVQQLAPVLAEGCLSIDETHSLQSLNFLMNVRFAVFSSQSPSSAATFAFSKFLTLYLVMPEILSSRGDIVADGDGCNARQDTDGRPLLRLLCDFVVLPVPLESCPLPHHSILLLP